MHIHVYTDIYQVIQSDLFYPRSLEVTFHPLKGHFNTAKRSRLESQGTYVYIYTQTHVKIHAIYTSRFKNLARPVCKICITSDFACCFFSSFFSTWGNPRPHGKGLPQCWELGCSLPGVGSRERLLPNGTRENGSVIYGQQGQRYGITTMSRFSLKTNSWNFLAGECLPKESKNVEVDGLVQMTFSFPCLS